jgi:hypothetical protein
MGDGRLDLDAIKARRAALLGAPWAYEGSEVFDCDENVVADLTWMPSAVGLFVAHAPQDVAVLLAEVERLRGLLARLEWAHYGECPVCGGSEMLSASTLMPGGHDPDCWLADELGRS